LTGQHHPTWHGTTENKLQEIIVTVQKIDEVENARTDNNSSSLITDKIAGE